MWSNKKNFIGKNSPPMIPYVTKVSVRYELYLKSAIFSRVISQIKWSILFVFFTQKSIFYINFLHQFFLTPFFSIFSHHFFRPFFSMFYTNFLTPFYLYFFIPIFEKWKKIFECLTGIPDRNSVKVMVRWQSHHRRSCLRLNIFYTNFSKNLNVLHNFCVKKIG